MRLKLLISYVGTGYSGWQIQEKPKPPPTVQGALEAALRTIAGKAVRVHGSGRTDSGVHAHGQVAHCDIPDTRAGLDWRHSLNAVLPRDIRVLDASPAAPDFHARKDALRKTYAYQFWQDRRFLPPHVRPYVWNCGMLDLDAMRDALPFLLGRHDFAGLRNAGTDVESTERTIMDARLDALAPCEYYPPHAPMLRLTITADGFLKQMVRNVAGLLAACGQGKIQPAQIPALLAARDRQAVPSVTAPPEGLALVSVKYPEP
ncbi:MULTISPECIES: tRNA pseudouridine(38-40) synthase TruA [Desulfovibrio]|uniref:tRNA pseudouridine synthase A n=3 Tax=Desulfovibrio TaxID=872 RepID=A0AA94HUJ2_DESDE|nr:MULTISPECIES: tRNA pseudouridine(38-40) synthase TruA [Desulfovibrio]ATD81804.1 tRNA pseudouridine(38-40) synthase TruA [Desulfovibrio sp. G11]MDY0204411.1 tRNA pseudouridine(38-40) synthase TruA [Desulfovibrio desulfuricans]SFW66537.1 tRNA pseudouridine38-40 synthase [Desulfovibrio desulfuricans]SPD34540.1 tRNA pseudouridine38-40 synthase [Desulfovibrio sp. G11]